MWPFKLFSANTQSDKDGDKAETPDQSASEAIEISDEPGDTTPKAQPVKESPSIPTFNLDSDEDTAKTDPADRAVPSLIEPKQPDSRPAGKPSAGSLMPPPAMRIPPKLNSLSPQTNGLRSGPNGPLPDRSPAAKRDNPGLAPLANTAGKRNKVLLKPGHSPLDWATLSRSNNLSGVTGLQRVTPSMLKYHHGRRGRAAWSSYKGKVYNITPYLPFHPGGEGELMRAAGKDGEKLFMEYHPWVNWDNMLGSCIVGIMVSEGDGDGLEGLD